jgi:hypothetical protein
MAHELPPKVLDFFRAHGAKGGEIGGKIAAEKMTPEARQERARKGGEAAAVARLARKALEAEQAAQKALEAQQTAQEPTSEPDLS